MFCGVFMAYDFPTEVIKGLPCISIIGNNKLLVSNYKKLLDFGNNKVRLLLKQSGILEITGCNLVIKEYNKYEMCIIGTFKDICFV